MVALQISCFLASFYPDSRSVKNCNAKNFSCMHSYRPQRSCGQGNVFTGVCLSTGGEGVCLSACWDARPPGPGRPPRDQADIPQTRQTPPPGTRQTPLEPDRPPWDQADSPQDQAHTPLDQADIPPRTRQTPPGKQTPAYGLRAAGTHPTGMHCCFI